MNVNRVELFPTLIHVVSGFLSKQECDGIIDYARTLEEKHHGAIPENGISNHDINYSFMDDVEKNVLQSATIKTRLKERFNEYANDVGYCNVELTNSWINFQYPDSQLVRHTHPDSLISAALYLKIDENSSKIYFYNPNPYIFFTEYAEFTKYSYQYQWIMPMVGDLVLFPSWMSHGSNGEKNRSPERVVVSINSRK